MSDNKSKYNDGDQPISLAEHLSAVLDDEAGSFEQRRVLDELTSDDNASNISSKDLSKKLSHYALIGESMRSTNPMTAAGPSFLAGIHDQISEEDQFHNVQLQDSAANDGESQSSIKPSSAMLRPVGGFALAASFAAVAFMGGQNYQLSNQLSEKSATIAAFTEVAKSEKLAQAENKATLVKSVAETSVENEDNLTPSKDDYKQANAHARSFLKRYVDSHVQYASTSTFVPSVRVIAYADY